MKHLSPEQIETLHTKLKEEKVLLETELGTISVQDPTNKADWNATDGDGQEKRNPDSNSRADHFEEIDTNQAISGDLEARLTEVNQALALVENKTYGVTESGEEILFERLEANPAAQTIIK